MKNILHRPRIVSAAASVLIMLILPWLTATFAGGDSAMAVCFILFFCVNPIYCAATGAFAGKDLRRLWCLPFISSALFPIGTWCFFAMGEAAFAMYAGIYLIIGLLAMSVSAFFHKKRRD